MKVAIALLVLSTFLPVAKRARATTLEVAYTTRLLRTDAPARIQSLRRLFERAREARAGCFMQIARGLAPVECYEVLGLERAWKILDRPRYLAKLRRLDAACVAAALRLEVPEVVGPQRHLSRTCRTRVTEARAIRRYRQTDARWSGD